MAARGRGRLLITGSQTSLMPDWVAGHGPYVAAKAAVQALAFTLRAEARDNGVAVSLLLLPAATNTEIGGNASRVPADSGEMVVRPGLPDPLPPFFIEPDEVAARALAGLRADLPLIVTDSGMRPLVDDYLDRIRAAYDSAAAWTPAAGTLSRR